MRDAWSPPGWFEDKTFERLSRSWEDPDWVDITLHSYQSRWDEAPPDPDSQWLDDKVKTTQTLDTAAIFIQGARDGFNPPPISEAMAEMSVGAFRREVLEGVGHFPTREAPMEVGAILIDHFKQNSCEVRFGSPRCSGAIQPTVPECETADGRTPGRFLARLSGCQPQGAQKRASIGVISRS